MQMHARAHASRDVKLCDGDTEWFLQIEKEISERRSEGRPVLVFFETAAVLQKFYRRPNVQALGPSRLDENVAAGARPSIVSRATRNNTVTLLTRNFGRGTDFMDACENERSRGGGGGVHVIQTFVSDDVSEEKQIQGSSRLV